MQKEQMTYKVWTFMESQIPRDSYKYVRLAVFVTPV